MVSSDRKVVFIDVSQMSEREFCNVLNIKYVPWYKSDIFWAVITCTTLPAIIQLLALLKLI